MDMAAINEDAISGTDLGLLRGNTFADPVNVAWHAQSIADRRAAGIDSRTAGTGKRNKRSVWTIATQSYSEAHFATFPPALIEPCIMAGSRSGDIVFDPFIGSGTVGQVAQALGRQWIGCELNESYGPLQDMRTAQLGMVL